MEPIKISVKGHIPRTYGTTGELEWCEAVAQEASNYAIKDLATIPLGATFSITFHFYRGLENRMYDVDNLAKSMIDTLFYGRKENKETGKTNLPCGVLFPDHLQKKKDRDDFYVFEAHIYKHLEEEPSKQGVDITVELREEVVSFKK